MTSPKFLIYSLTIILCIGLKLFYRQANTEDLHFILQPTSSLVGTCTGLSFENVAGKGFYHKASDVLIDKSCAGVTFWVIAIAMSVFVGLHYYQTRNYIILFPSLILGTYLLAVIANTCRIVIAIFLLRLTPDLPFLAEPIWHSVQGALVYLILLVSFYLLSQYIHPKIAKHYA